MKSQTHNKDSAFDQVPKVNQSLVFGSAFKEHKLRNGNKPVESVNALEEEVIDDGYHNDLTRQTATIQNSSPLKKPKLDDEKISEQILHHRRLSQSMYGKSCLFNLYDDDLFRRVSNGPVIKNSLQNFYLRGQSVLEKELEYCKRIPEKERVMIKDHILNEDGEGEPHAKGTEVIL